MNERKVHIELTEGQARVLVRLAQVTVEHIRDFDSVQAEVGELGGRAIMALYEQLGIYLPAEGEQSRHCPTCGHRAHPGRVCLADGGAEPCCCDHGLAAGTRYDDQDRPYRVGEGEPDTDDQLATALEHAHGLVKRLAWALTGMIALVKDVGERPGMPETCRGAVRKAQAALLEVPALLLEDLGITIPQ